MTDPPDARDPTTPLLRLRPVSLFLTLHFNGKALTKQQFCAFPVSRKSTGWDWLDHGRGHHLLAQLDHHL